jgi:hypothetical protein
VLLGRGEFSMRFRKLLSGIVEHHLCFEQLTMLLMKLDTLIDEHFEKLLDAVQAILLLPVRFVTRGGFSRS